MTAKTSGDSSRGVSANIFAGIQDSFTTQGLNTDPGATRLLAGLVGHPPGQGETQTRLAR